jgi:polysaccharide export outer membrane protein
MRAAFLGILALLYGLALAQGPSTVRAGDVVVVAVAGLPDYNTETTVLSDGTISGAGFSRVRVAGLTVDAARKAVEAELRKRLRDPAVSFYIKSPAPTFVYVSGLSRGNPPVPWAPGLTVRQVLSSVDLPADPDQLEARLSRGNRAPQPLDLPAILQGEADGGIALEPGDTILIALKPYVRVWVTGFVARPGQIRVDRGTDVYQAVAAAGGVTRAPVTTVNAVTAPSEFVLTVRRGGSRMEFPIQANRATETATLEEGDVINVEAAGVLRVAVGGEVARPGELVLPENTSLEGVLASAGGPRETGTLKNVVVLRAGETFSVDLSDPGKPSGFRLQSGDTILVRRNESFVYVMGDVAQPGRYAFADNEVIRAADALAKAKGLNPRGTNRRVVHITAGADGKYLARQFHIDDWLKLGDPKANPELKPGDVLFFGTPKGINPANILQFATTIFYLDRIFDRP